MANPEKDQPRSRERITQEVWSVRSTTFRRSNRGFIPPTDVIELQDHLVVLVEIAGMRADAFQIALHERNLIISGIREQPPFDFDQPAYHQVEIDFGEFRTEIQLPWLVDQNAVRAIYGEGFLQIDLPKQQPEQITIVKTADADTDKQD
jgi:HSP20 family protein